MNIKCDFCNEFAGGLENSFAARYHGVLRNRIIVSTDNFRILPSLGQIVEGYLLIVPLKHYTALADMPPYLITELSELCERARSGLSKAYGPSLLFEHGVRSTEAGGCGVDHAHLHVVPLAGGPLKELRQQHSFHLIGDISEIRELPQDSSYLYYQEASSQACVFDIDFMPSQYVRKLLAESLGNDFWDWRKCGRESALISTLERLSGSFDNIDMSQLNSMVAVR